MTFAPVHASGAAGSLHPSSSACAPSCYAAAQPFLAGNAVRMSEKEIAKSVKIPTIKATAVQDPVSECH